MSIRIVEADLTVSKHREPVLALVDACSMDAMASAKTLDPDIRACLSPSLQKGYGNNSRAVNAYEVAGFSPYSFQEGSGTSIFSTKPQR